MLTCCCKDVLQGFVGVDVNYANIQFDLCSLCQPWIKNDIVMNTSHMEFKGIDVDH